MYVTWQNDVWECSGNVNDDGIHPDVEELNTSDIMFEPLHSASLPQGLLTFASLLLCQSPV